MDSLELPLGRPPTPGEVRWAGGGAGEAWGVRECREAPPPGGWREVAKAGARKRLAVSDLSFFDAGAPLSVVSACPTPGQSKKVHGEPPGNSLPLPRTTLQ